MDEGSRTILNEQNHPKYKNVNLAPPNNRRRLSRLAGEGDVPGGDKTLTAAG